MTIRVIPAFSDLSDQIRLHSHHSIDLRCFNQSSCMSSPESAPLPRSSSFYYFRSNSSIPPPRQIESDTSNVFLPHIIPHVIKRIVRSVAAVVLPIVLIPFHYFLLILSVITTILAMLFLSLRAFVVYIEIGMNTLSQLYSDYALDGKRIGRRKRDLLRRVVIEREESVRAERPRARGRGVTIA